MIILNANILKKTKKRKLKKKIIQINYETIFMVKNIENFFTKEHLSIIRIILYKCRN